jgi:hypothetical protein
VRTSFAIRVVIRVLVPVCVASEMVSCLSPTLPLPPPESPSVARGPDGDHVELVAACGSAESGATVVIINENPQVAQNLKANAAISDDCGAWNAVVYAHGNDVLNIFQVIGGEASSPTGFQVPSAL